MASIDGHHKARAELKAKTDPPHFILLFIFAIALNESKSMNAFRFLTH